MIIAKSEIAGKLAKVKAAVPSKSSVPVMEGVLVTGDQLVAYDLRLGITARIPAETETPFILTPKAISMIAALPDGDIEIVPENNSIKIKAAGIKNSFVTCEPEQFARPTPPEGGNSDIIKAETLREFASAVMYAASTNEARPVHTGLLFEASGGTLNIVAVDGYRLAWNKAEYDGELKFVVPKTTVEKMLKIGIDGDVEIAHNDKSAMFKTEDYTVYTRLLEGDFLKYREVVPNHEKKFTVDRQALLAAVNRVIICSDETARNPAVLTFGENLITLSVSGCYAQYTEEVAAGGLDGDGLRIGLNANYLRDALKAYDADTLTVSYNSGTAPIIMTDGKLLSMLLPVRLKADQ